MKKHIAILLCACMALGAFTGCGKDEQTDVSASAEKEIAVIATETLLAASEYDVNDYVVLNDYQNMNIQLAKDYAVTEDAIKEAVNGLLAYYPTYEETDKKIVEAGDVVNISYVGRMDGEAFEGGSGDYHLEIGSNSFIAGFEDGLIGAKVGETVTLDLTFPENYSSTDVAGKPVTFEVEVNAIEETSSLTYDTMTDKNISEVLGDYGISTKDEVINLAKQNLESTNLSLKMSDLQDLVMETMITECEVTIPDGLLESKIEQTKNLVTFQMGDAEQSFEEYTGMTEDELKEYVTGVVTKELILEALVDDMSISVLESEFDEFVTSCMSNYGYTEENAFFENYGGKEIVQLSYAENVALNQLVALYAEE